MKRKQHHERSGRGLRMVQKAGARERREPTPALAKITQPALAGIYPRHRLFRLLDQARRKHSIIWVAGPGGAGKTILIASYLQARRQRALWYQVDPTDNDVGSFFYYLGLAVKESAPRFRRPMPLLTREYLGGLSAFAVNYFRELFSRLKAPAVMVLDDYRDLATDGTVQDVLEHGLAEIPAGVNVIVVSREPPPAAFARLRASGKIGLVGWEDLKFTETESAGIVKLRTRALSLTTQARERLYQHTQGWVAGLVLLTEQAERNVAAIGDTGQFAGAEIFDYFASEIFRHTEANIQTFLLKTALLPKIALSVAQALTGEPNTEAILSYLTRRNLFTVRHMDGSYEYHPLFRDFLTSRAAAEYSCEEFRAIKRESARLLADAGDIENAVALLLQTPPDAREALALILQHANTLVATGRTHTLEQWLTTLPSAMRAGDPSVLYWLGVCRLAYAPAEARRHFEQAFALFESRGDTSALYQTWSGIIESFVLERDDFTPMRRWLDVYHSLGGNGAPPAREVEVDSTFTYVLGLVSTAFDHLDLPLYAKRAARLLARESDADRWSKQVVVLIPFYLWTGDRAETRDLIDSLALRAHALKEKPLAQLSWYTWKCLYDAGRSAPESSLAATTEGLELAARSGIHVWDTQLLGYGIWGQLCAGNVATARRLLDQLRPLVGPGKVSNAFFNHFASLVFLHEGNIGEAAAHARRSAQQARDAGMFLGAVSYSLGYAYILAEQGKVGEAMNLLAEVRTKAQGMNGRAFISYAALCEAHVHVLAEEYDPAARALKEALAIMRELEVVAPAYCPREVAARLYALALEANIERDYVRMTIRRTKLTPPGAVLSEHWPWPVRIRALGRFAVLKDDQVLTFGKARKKPLELLRTLVVLGGREISVSRLAQLLWPEADGDLARRSMETTLHRLRRLVGDECILRHENQLSLNPQYCWLDVHAFEALAERQDDSMPAVIRARRLLELYQGPFLGDEDTAAGMVPRERLRSKFIRAMVDVGAQLEGEGSHELAASYYEKAIDIEALAEDLYRHLMQCYYRLHRPAQALAVYRRCRTALRCTLSIDPSDATESLYREIKRCS